MSSNVSKIKFIRLYFGSRSIVARYRISTWRADPRAAGGGAKNRTQLDGTRIRRQSARGVHK